MKCPFCGSDDTQVKDSRPAQENSAIRRRRACNSCGARFTTFERVQLREMTVVKSTGSREPLDREKLVRSMRIALKALTRRFYQRQRKAAGRGDPVLEDGTQTTLLDKVLNPAEPNAWPKRAAAILHGLHLPVNPLLPAWPCCPG